VMGEFGWRELQGCAEREAALRRNVFRQTEAREVALMEAIAAHFRGLAEDEEEAREAGFSLFRVPGL
jgi:hypothetical protein